VKNAADETKKIKEENDLKEKLTAVDEDDKDKSKDTKFA
jgi:hypothetical protein